MDKRWIPHKEVNNHTILQLAESLKIDLIHAKLLAQRGIFDFASARSFFRPDLENLHNPFLMKDMDKAVARLSKAIDDKETILVYGDYDVDGTTAVTLVYSFLKERNVHCYYYIPDRYQEGYGFSYRGIDWAAEHDVSLIITLDCGIKDGEKVKYATEKGIDVVICDHHHVEDIPPAAAVLDPHRPDCSYPEKVLSGCGVGFKMLQGYCLQNNILLDELLCYLDILTISIGADIVPITGENRIFAYYGLKLLAEEKKRPGIQALLDSSNFTKQELTISDVVFVLAPRINAAGRIASGKQAVELLLAKDLATATALSPMLEEVNAHRKDLDKSITLEAKQLIENDNFYTTSFSTLIANKGWHKGVVGIVASRLVEEYYKPTIVLVDDGSTMSGSARSIEGVDILEVIDQCKELLIQYGGHAMAAGVSLKSENFKPFRQQLDEIMKTYLNNVLPTPFIEYDAEITLEEITPKFYRILKQYAPFGPMNMSPIFLAKNIRNAQYTRGVGKDESHLKLHAVHSDSKLSMHGIGFNLGCWAEYLQKGGEVDILFSIEENTFNGATSLQLLVKDIKKSKTSSYQVIPRVGDSFE